MGSVDYDAVAREYSRHRRVHPEVLRRLLLDGEIDRASRVLEVGCGTGNYTAAIHRATGCEPWGVDPSGAMLQQAMAQCPTARLQAGRAEALGVPDAEFDLVFSVDVIHPRTFPREGPLLPPFDPARGSPARPRPDGARPPMGAPPLRVPLCDALGADAMMKASRRNP